MSGVEVDPQCKNIFDEVQLGKKHRYVIFKIDAGKIRVDKIGERSADFDAFLDDLKQKEGEIDDCRYAIFDYEYLVETQGTEASFRSKVVLVLWCPDNARVKKKMVYSSSFDSLKKTLVGIQNTIQANGDDEITKECVEKTLVSSART